MSSARNLHKPSYREVSEDGSVRPASTYKWLFLVILVILLIIAGLIGFFRQPALQIATVEVQGTRSLDPMRVQESAQSFISGFYAWVIPRSNVLLISKSAWTSALLHTIPTLEFVSIELIDRTRAIIHVVERDPMYVWCDADDSQCYFIDDNGYVFEPAPVFSEGVYLVFRGGQLAGSPDPLRGVVMPQSHFSDLERLILALKGRAMTVTSITFLPEGDITLSFDSLAGRAVGTSAHLLVTENFLEGKIVQMLDLMMQDPVFNEQFSAVSNTLEYIDFRFDNKIIYKFKDGGEMTQNG